VNLRCVLLSLGLLAGCGVLQAREPMANFGEAYQGPKTLSVELAPTAKGDQALIKINGVNHPWNDKVLLATVRKINDQRTHYVIKHEGADFMVMQDDDRGPRLMLPGLGELPLRFDRAAALEVRTEHLMTDLENQRAAK